MRRRWLRPCPPGRSSTCRWRTLLKDSRAWHAKTTRVENSSKDFRKIGDVSTVNTHENCCTNCDVSSINIHESGCVTRYVSCLNLDENRCMTGYMSFLNNHENGCMTCDESLSRCDDRSTRRSLLAVQNVFPSSNPGAHPCLMSHALPMGTAAVRKIKPGIEPIISTFKIKAETARDLLKCIRMTALNFRVNSGDADADVSKPRHLTNTLIHNQNMLHPPEKQRLLRNIPELR